MMGPRSVSRPVSALLLALFCGCAWSATYQVGSGKTYPRLSNVPTLAPGDIVEIYSGTYNEFKLFSVHGTAAAPITIRGMGTTKPIFDGTGLNVTGVLPTPRALFQLEGHYYTVENIEFRNASNSSLNGSGLRIRANNVTIRNCYIHDCQMGVMSDSNDNLVLESCDIGFCGADAYSHNLYLNGNRTYVRYCYIHDSKVGQNFKTRGHYTELLYNYIANSADGEVCLVDSSLTTTANSNAVMIGNIVASKVRGSNANLIKFVEFGGDTGNAHTGTLYAFNNTFVAAQPNNHFFRMDAAGANLVARNNILMGSNTVVGIASGTVSGSNNWVQTGAAIPAGFTGTLTGSSPGFVNAGTRDFHLTSTSACLNRGTNSLTYNDSTPAAQNGTPTKEYTNLNFVARASDGTLDIGAYERASAPPPNQAPVARFTATPTSGTAPLAVSFNGTTSSDSDGSISSYAWNFGDGATGSGSTISHTYTATGTFTARLTVTDNAGATGTTTATITVSTAPPPNAAPVARFTATPTSGTAPLAVSFNGTTSSDSDGTISSYAWNFGDGATGSGSTLSHTYTAAGTFTARLTVTDNRGATGTTTATITVTAPNAAPVARFTATPTSGTAPLAVSFNGTTSSDSDGTISSYAWNFGDGATGSGSTLSHTYTAVGTFTARLTVTDNRGATGTTTATITVSAPNAAPVARFTATPTSGTAPLAVSFNGTTSSDSDGTISSYAWNFGDGATGSGSTLSHTYTAVGTFTARLTVTDNRGATGTTTATITVSGTTSTGTGLTGTYFNNSDFTAQVLTRIDPTVNFDWGSGSPASSIGADTFSVRWTGQVVPRYSETCTFYTVSDDGVRLWVNNQLVINNWTLHAPKENSGTIALTAGQKYSIKMEFFENGGGAVAKLLWSSARQAKQAIPQSQLYPDTAAAAPVALAADLPVELLSPVTASPSPAQTGDSVNFSLIAADLSDGESTVTWDFGDGTRGSGANAAHSFTAPGVYTATVTISNSLGATSAAVDVTVNAEPAAALDSAKVSGSISTRTGKELCSIGGALTLPADLKTDGAAVRIELNGAGADFVLDHSGRAKSANGTFRLLNKGGKGAFSAKLVNPGLANVIDGGASSVSATLRVRIGGELFEAPLTLNVKSGKTIHFGN